ncbi:BlaI/MecI/CopY family transcriptional regulator [Novosphingobium sp.]|uniref:BlaI/MecI/CopY family transcriptional regulator n=1 Tax=Novosphingobium sp. TaxID=1874826 RepID=UPI0025FE3209|nr:BlaI/MecI/CopY family transcriptional regulator [Novosphingobium sp.]
MAEERITEAEQAVMEALWTSAPLSATAVCDAVCEPRGWTLPTVKTLLSRLVAKDAIHAERDGKRFLYSPRIARSAFAAGESRRLVDRLFGGRTAPLIAHLAEQETLTDRDLAEIETLLKTLRGDAGE